MSGQILDGRKLAQTIKADLKNEVASLKKLTGGTPYLVNIIMGDEAGSGAYGKSQKKAAEEIGIRYDLRMLSHDISQEELIRQITELNDNPDVNGIMIHKPVPQQIRYREISNYIDISKDLEGINVANIGKMMLGETNLIPCTPAAVMEHIKTTGDIRGKETVIVGASEIVGKPLSLLLLKEFATVTICHIATSEAGRLQEHVGRAEVLIVAAGKAGLIKGDWIKKGAIVIDVGINQVERKIVGDVDFDGAVKRASYITPVPGGVGPVTVVMLMRNGIEAYKAQLK